MSCFLVFLHANTHIGRTQKRELGNPPRTVHSVRVLRAETKNAEIQVCVRVASHVFSGPKRKVLKSVDVCVCVCRFARVFRAETKNAEIRVCVWPGGRPSPFFRGEMARGSPQPFLKG